MAAASFGNECVLISINQWLAGSQPSLHDPHAPGPSFPFSSSEGDYVISDECVLQGPFPKVELQTEAGPSRWPTGLEAPAWPCSDGSPVRTPDSAWSTRPRGPACSAHTRWGAPAAWGALSPRGHSALARGPTQEPQGQAWLVSVHCFVYRLCTTHSASCFLLPLPALSPRVTRGKEGSVDSFVQGLLCLQGLSPQGL